MCICLSATIICVVKEDNTLDLENRNTDEFIKQRIHFICGYKVMLDSDLAELYGVPTKRFNEQIKRNPQRLPSDFMFLLTKEEFENLNRSQFATGSQKHRNPKFLPYAFTEHGVAMLSSVLKSDRAIQMNIFIIKAFIILRDTLDSNKDIEIRMGKVEKRQIEQADILRHIHRAVAHMIEKEDSPKEKIGFQKKDDSEID